MQSGHSEPFCRNWAVRRLIHLLLLAFGAFSILADDITNNPAPPVQSHEINLVRDIFLVFIIVVIVVVSLILIAIGFAAITALCALAGALTALGVLSSSVAIGFIRQSPASGVRAMVIQLGALIGVPCGIASAWIVAWVSHSQTGATARFLVGGACGLVCGILLACVVNYIWGRLAAWIIELYDRRNRPPDLLMEE